MKIALFFLYFLGLTIALADENKVFVYNENGKIDPFWPLVSSNGSLIAYDSDTAVSDIVLEGIVTDANGNNLAIINGKVVKLGDWVGSYSVESITNEQVNLTKDQEHLTVRLKKGGV